MNSVDADKDKRDQPAIRVVLHPYATALPLGCFAFGIGNVLLSAFSVHWIPLSETTLLAVMLLGFVAPLELIPCIMAFLSRDTGAATAMGLFAAGWVVQGIQLLIMKPGTPSPAAGIFLLLLALCLAILTIATFKSKPLIGTLFIIAFFRSISAALFDFGLGTMGIVAAVLGFLLAIFAFYSGLGLLLEDVQQRPLPMVFRRGKAKEAMLAGLPEQVEHVATEAGVRPQL